MSAFIHCIDFWDQPVIGQVANGNTEVEILCISLLCGLAHSVSVILPSIKTEADLNVAELAESKRVKAGQDY